MGILLFLANSQTCDSDVNVLPHVWIRIIFAKMHFGWLVVMQLFLAGNLNEKSRKSHLVTANCCFIFRAVSQTRGGGGGGTVWRHLLFLFYFHIIQSMRFLSRICLLRTSLRGEKSKAKKSNQFKILSLQMEATTVRGIFFAS